MEREKKIEEEKIKIVKEIEELKNYGDDELNEQNKEQIKKMELKLKEKDKSLKELNTRINTLQIMLIKKIDPKSCLEMILSNLKDAYKEKDASFFGKTKNEIKSKIEEIEKFLNENKDDENEKDLKKKVEEMKIFIINNKIN